MATKQHYGISGIYQITNLVNGKFYIGSSNNIGKRLSWHKCNLEKGSHNNPHLQFSFNKYGLENFKFELVLECPIDYLFAYEQQYFNDLKPQYNILPIAGSPQGVKMKEETKRKIGEANKLVKHTKEWNEKVRMANLKNGHKPPRFAVDNSAKNRTKKILVWVEDNLAEMFDGAKDVAKKYNISRVRYVNSACLGRHTLCGLKAEYVYECN